MESLKKSNHVVMNRDNHRERPRESSSDPENRSRFNERKRNRPMKKEVKEFGKPEVSNSRKSDSGNQPKEQPNFNVSGKLAEDTNVFNGVVIKYNEPIEARKPNKRWRLYPFKGNEPLPMLPIHRQSAYLLGRERRVADIPIDHPSCSKQHAVLQFRLVPYTREDGTNGRRIRPYIIDLDSANGTFLNNKRIEPRRYVEILERDILKFGFSSREYVLLHEESVAAADDDDESEMPTETAEAEQS